MPYPSPDQSNATSATLFFSLSARNGKFLKAPLAPPRARPARHSTRSGPSKQSPSNPADGTTRHQPPEALMTHPVRLFPSAHGRPLSQERHDFNASGRFTASPSTARKERAKARLWQVGSRTLYTGLKRGQPAISCTRKLPYLK